MINNNVALVDLVPKKVQETCQEEFHILEKEWNFIKEAVDTGDISLWEDAYYMHQKLMFLVKMAKDTKTEEYILMQNELLQITSNYRMIG